MDSKQVWSLLARGGAEPYEQVMVADGQTQLRLHKYNGLLDPAGAEALGGALAERLAGRGATLVVVWQDVEDLVLGFVTGWHLGVPVLRTFNEDGLVGYAGPLPSSTRAVLVTDCLRDQVAPRAVRALLERAGGELLGVAAVVDAGLPDEPLLASLVEFSSRPTAASES